MADKKPRRRGTAPNRRADPKPPTDTDEITLLSGHPVLCLRHVQRGWGVGELTDAQCREFLVKWEKRAKLTWKQLVQHPRHGLGSELLPSSKFNPSPPQELARDRYMVFRHEGNLPFTGFRTGDAFHVLWIEKTYNELYDHGTGDSILGDWPPHSLPQPHWADGTRSRFDPRLSTSPDVLRPHIRPVPLGFPVATTI
ncbi:MAG: hypothetical protein KC435_09625 [Thermomicrobiales bacterium]|nr:hypothetical protein [Thermomicrobiales bacterium]